MKYLIPKFLKIAQSGHTGYRKGDNERWTEILYNDIFCFLPKNLQPTSSSLMQTVLKWSLCGTNRTLEAKIGGDNVLLATAYVFVLPGSIWKSRRRLNMRRLLAQFVVLKFYAADDYTSAAMFNSHSKGWAVSIGSYSIQLSSQCNSRVVNYDHT